MNKVVSAIGAVVIGLSAAPAFAHHSYATFDMSKTIDVKGTIKEWHFTNPHSWIVLLPQGAASDAAGVYVEANGPGYLVHNGWHRNSLKPGDVVTVTMNPLRDGSPGGSLAQVTFADGHELDTKFHLGGK